MSTEAVNFSNVRVKVNKKYHGIYRELTQNVKEVRHKVFEQHSDVFTLCAVLGARTGVCSPDRREFLFWSWTFNANQMTTLKSLAITAENKYEYLADPEGMFQCVSAFADAGMEILISKVLAEYLREEEGDYTLRFSDADQLEKSILHFIRDEMTQSPI